MIQEIAATLIQINEETLDEVVKLLNSHTASRIWICGNGGSASASQHFSSDLLNVGYDVVCLNDNLARIHARFMDD